MKTLVIFASLILGLRIAATADAATTITDDSSVVSKPVVTMLAQRSEKSLLSLVERKMTRLSRQPEWQTYMTVVSMYNQNPVSVLTLSATEQDKFKRASSAVTNRLLKQPDAAANELLTQVNNTAQMITYFWVVSQNDAQVPDNE